MRCHQHRFNQKGQTLVNALVGLGVTAILSVTIASIMMMQSKESRALGEKLASLDLQRTVISNLANTSTCNALFAPTNVIVPAGTTGPGTGPSQPQGGLLGGVINIVNSVVTFNLNTITPQTPLVFGVQKIPGVAGAPAIISSGEKVSPTSNTLFLLPSDAAVPGIQVIVTSASTALLRLNFDQSKLVRPIRSLDFPLNLQTSGAPAQTAIDGCSNTATPAQWQCISMGGDFFTPGSLTCVRIIDGTYCRLGSNNNGFFPTHTRSSNWRCAGAAGKWPGAGPWTCSVASSSSGMIGFPTGQPACVRTTDGMLCTLTTRFDFWSNRSTTPKWSCIAGNGWPQ